MCRNTKISVIVPVYNTEKYLDRCIQNILAQTYADFELLLVEDGSMDLLGVYVIDMPSRIFELGYSTRKMMDSQCKTIWYNKSIRGICSFC